jgi:hypothetical protein
MLTESDAHALMMADDIAARAEHGVTPLRLIHAGEELPLIRAYVIMRTAMAEAARLLHQIEARDSAAKP